MWGWYGLWVYKAIINILLTSLVAPTPEDTLPAELRDISASDAHVITSGQEMIYRYGQMRAKGRCTVCAAFLTIRTGPVGFGCA